MPSNFYVVTKSLREYVIPFIALKQGSHTYGFRIKDAFFEDLEYSIIHSGDVEVDLILEKTDTMLIGNFSLEGIVSTDCDRCSDPINVAVKGEFRLVFKFGTEISDDETLVMIHPDSYEIDVRDTIYELITVSLPARSIHEKGECNEEMMNALNEYLLNPIDDEDEDDDEDWEDDDDNDDDDDDDDGIDPRWSSLKNLN